MSIENLADESIVQFYESVRKQVEFDKSARYPFVTGRSVRDYAQSLREEIDRRRLAGAVHPMASLAVHERHRSP